MLLKYNDKATFHAALGIIFEAGETKEIPDVVGSLLLQTFVGMFEDVTPKAEPKTKKEPEVKTKG